MRDLTSPRALVLRGGLRRRVPGRDVVRGDVIVLAEGDRVPADARLISATDLHTDESLLTGESVPVRKVAATASGRAPGRPGGDDLPYVFSATLVVGGHGLAEVVATGARSEIGKIGSAADRRHHLRAHHAGAEAPPEVPGRLRGGIELRPTGLGSHRPHRPLDGRHARRRGGRVAPPCAAFPPQLKGTST